MSMHLDFQPHSWYMGFAIQKTGIDKNDITDYPFNAYIANGNTYMVDDVHGATLDKVKTNIREYHLSKHNGYGERIAKRRLEQIRANLIAESVSYDELAELSRLREYIADDDVQLREAAGLPEYETQEARKTQHA